MAEPKKAIIICDDVGREYVIIDDMLTPHRGDAAGLRKLFAKHGVTDVVQRIGLSDHQYGDQPDDTYPVEKWLEWAESVE